jgi:cell wall-associated NlpC family hydrolase
MRWTLLSLMLASAAVATPATAAEKVNLIEHIEAGLARDAAIARPDRARLLEALRQQLGAYAFDVLAAADRPAAAAVVDLAAEGLAGGVAAERCAAVAAAAYRAMARGAPVELVAGIARYGFGHQLAAGRIAAWSTGAAELLRFDVPRPVVEELVHQAVRGDWPAATFRSYKWALVRATRAGHDPERFARFLMARQAAGQHRPGAIAAAALRAFAAAARAGEPPPALAYDSPILDPEPLPPAPALPPDGQPSLAPTPGEPAGPEALDGPDGPDGPTGQARQARLERLLAAAESFLGTPYVWGGRSRRGTDCSGLTQTAYAAVGIRIGRRVRDQWHAGRPVPRHRLRPGDLVFFRTLGRRISHVGIVTDPAEQAFIHASSSRGVVRSKLTAAYYQTRYAGARRLLKPPSP